MMRKLINSSLRLRVLVTVLAAGILVAGVTQLRDARVDLHPEFTPTIVEIQTEALGLSAQEVEQLITSPMEADLLNGVAWLQDIRSESVAGLSSVVMTFEPGTPLYRARQVVQERMAQAFALPGVSKPPQMLQPVSSTSRTMMIGLSSKTLSLIDISQLARWTIKPRLMGVRGRRQRVDVRPPGAPAPGPGRPQEPERQGRRAPRRGRGHRERPVGVAAQLPRGVHPGNRRLHRDRCPASRDPARVADPECR